MHIPEPGNWSAACDTLKEMVSYLDNHFGKTISECNQTNEQHETTKLLNEEVRKLQQKLQSLYNELNTPMNENF